MNDQNQYQYNQQNNQFYQVNPVSWRISQLIMTPLFLTAAIAYSAQVVCSLIGSMSGASLVTRILSLIPGGGSAIQSLQMLSGLRRLAGGALSVNILISMLPSAFILAGIWMLYVSARKIQTAPLSTTGLTIISIVVLIQFILLIVLAVITAIAAVVVSVSSLSYSDGGTAFLSFLMVIILFAPVFLIAFLYFTKLRTTVLNMKTVIETAIPNSEVSLFVEVFCYISAAGSILLALFSFISLWSFLSNAGGATACIAFGMLLRRYRALMEELCAGGAGAAGFRPAPNQGRQGNAPFANQGSQGYSPNQNQGQQGYSPYPNRNQQGYNLYPNQNLQGYNPYPNQNQQGYNPYPNQNHQGYNPYPNQNQQGYNPYPNQNQQGYNPYPNQNQQGYSPYPNQGQQDYNRYQQGYNQSQQMNSPYQSQPGIHRPSDQNRQIVNPYAEQPQQAVHSDPNRGQQAANQYPKQQGPETAKPMSELPQTPAPREQSSSDQALQKDDNATFVLPYYNETSVFTGYVDEGGSKRTVRLTRKSTNETFAVSKNSFWIGKDPLQVDYCITDNAAVSRRHVLITVKFGKCFVKDNHSTNSTILNGKVLPPDKDQPLVSGDVITIADEDFTVSIE